MASIVWEPALVGAGLAGDWRFVRGKDWIPVFRTRSRRPCALFDCSRQLECPEHRYPTLPVQAVIAGKAGSHQGQPHQDHNGTTLVRSRFLAVRFRRAAHRACFEDMA